jgi:hypothetical protein
MQAAQQLALRVTAAVRHGGFSWCWYEMEKPPQCGGSWTKELKGMVAPANMVAAKEFVAPVRSFLKNANRWS